MASKIGKKNTTVVDRLLEQPHRFSFFQAVRLLVASGGARALGASHGKLGTTTSVNDEAVRFRSAPSLEFPTSEIVGVRVQRDLASSETIGGDVQSGEKSIEMEVAFWGLVGPVGALPNHYTQVMIDRMRKGDDALHDFLDMFSHRQLSLFYRAWEKHYVIAGFESALREQNPAADLLRQSLLSIVGRGTNSVRDRLEVLDDVCVYYGGFFSDQPNAESLGSMASDFLGLPSKVLSLFGQWLLLPPSEQSRLGMIGGHSRLGVEIVLGERTWDPNSKFRVQIGPVQWDDFLRLMPTGSELTQICQLIRSYVGCEFEFDIQVVLQADEIPLCELGDANGDVETTSPSMMPRLGWNTWLRSQPILHNSTDAVFRNDGSPIE